MDFVALDVETANASLDSICAVGLAFVHSGSVTVMWNTLINPEDFFDGLNVSIHGIEEEHVADSPIFPSVMKQLVKAIGQLSVVHHTGFDRAAVRMACEKYRLAPPEWTWLDSARVARRAWPDKYADYGYGLANVCADLEIIFRHHEAEQDALAAAQIMLRASAETGMDLAAWQERVKQAIIIRPGELPDGRIAMAGNPDGPLAGETLVFTGTLQLTRYEAATIAAAAGCAVESGVTKRTTVLVVGNQDIARLAGADKSTKHRKAEALILKGRAIRIVGETDFIAMTKE